MNSDRRYFLYFMSLCTAGLTTACIPMRQDEGGRIASRLRIAEASGNGSLGVAFFSPQTGQSYGHNSFARFPHCSSFKTSLAALVLKMDQEGKIDASERMRWSEDELLAYSPFTRPRTGQGATLIELAEQTQKTSDNTAANILLKRLGGPQGLTRFWRSVGDQTSRLDRIEPEVNLVPPGEIRDTTTPAAMARTLASLLYGNVLDQRRRAMLKQWMTDTKTGANRVRAGLPQSWRSGDKTGTSLAPGMGSVYVDIGFAEPPEGPPYVFATYFRAPEQHLRMEPQAEKVLAETGSVLARLGTTSVL